MAADSLTGEDVDLLLGVVRGLINPEEAAKSIENGGGEQSSRTGTRGARVRRIRAVKLLLQSVAVQHAIFPRIAVLSPPSAPDTHSAERETFPRPGKSEL